MDDKTSHEIEIARADHSTTTRDLLLTYLGHEKKGQEPVETEKKQYPVNHLGVALLTSDYEHRLNVRSLREKNYRERQIEDSKRSAALGGQTMLQVLSNEERKAKSLLKKTGHKITKPKKR